MRRIILGLFAALAFAGGALAQPGPAPSAQIVANSATPYTTAVGASSCNSASITGANDSCYGYQAGKSLTSGAGMTLVGQGAGYADTGGTDCILLGLESGANIGACNHDIAAGYYAMGFANVSGSYNICFGYECMVNLTGGSYNIGIGGFALGATTTTNSQIAIGWQSLMAVTTGARNVAIGDSTSKALIGGVDDVVIGYQSNIKGTDTLGSVLIGTGVLGSYVSGAMYGVHSIGIGTSVFAACTSCYENVQVGSGNETYATSGHFDNGVGVQADQNITTGSDDSCVGTSCLGDVTSGGDNNGLGLNAGYNATAGANDCTTCTNDLFLGENTLFPNSTQTDHETIIGNDAIGQGVSNSVTLGRTSGGTLDTTYAAFIKYKVLTVSTLPSCTSALDGLTSYVSDALTPAFGVAVTGGSTTHAPVYCDGSGTPTWKVG